MSSLVPEDASLSAKVFTPGLVRKGIKYTETKSKGELDCNPSFFSFFLRDVHCGYPNLSPMYFNHVLITLISHLFG
jgi:hypothetical protein